MSRKGLFYKPAKHKKLAEIISLESPSKARRSVSILRRMFRRAKTRKEKRTIKQATVLAANRARAASKRKDLSRRERKQLREEADIYTQAYKEMEL
ncbi:hypothetical protein AciM339_0224 [Aciduliprofundum sp. MAR08-339]|uniref:hypothetical protein n=1 Tax=Aciduliprofundum sp. (strain MAR08-339) TaxID=673860 RepID=UPI0002A4C32D|nr:hypothetical protein AciM339_0192 [Aciduliprofundum sp. MAR08-339]AGB04121.1 hypothetical protein AciM339_0224 [Aciduliprofundum sp. MAR08-339]